MTVLEFDNYKTYLRHITDVEKRGIVKKLADAAGCQRSYISQVLSTQVHLTSDHVYGIGLFLHMQDYELDYFLLLLEKEKASSLPYREKLQGKLAQSKRHALRLSKQIKEEETQVIPEAYYSAWYFSAIHIATSIDKLKDEDDFSKYLSLPKKLVSKVLRELERWGLIEFNGESWNYVGSRVIHLRDDSFLNRINHINWRTQALSRALSPIQDVHYTSVFTISKKDVERIREKLLNFIHEHRKDVDASSSETLVAFCCDYFVAGS